MVAHINKANIIISLMSAIILLFCSCSLNYSQESYTEDIVPEFKFENMSLKKYEANSLTMEILADTMEQYKNDGGNFALNAKFSTWNKNNEIQSTGSCKILGIYTKQKLYTMFNDIIIKNLTNDFEIYATSLKYNENTEQLTSSEIDKVFVKQKDVKIEGSGFSASGISQSYSFSKLNSGTIISEDN